MIIKLYIYELDTCKFVYEDTGSADDIIRDLGDNKGFTLTPPPDYNHVWRWIDTKWVADEPEPEPIEDLQAQVWEGIKAKRLEQTTSGVLVKSVDKVFHTDDISAIQYSNVAGMIALGNYEPIEWKVKDNTWLLLTEDLFRELQTAMSQKTNANYAVAEQHKAAMLLADNPLEYDYSGNWV